MPPDETTTLADASGVTDRLVDPKLKTQGLPRVAGHARATLWRTSSIHRAGQTRGLRRVSGPKSDENLAGESHAGVANVSSFRDAPQFEVEQREAHVHAVRLQTRRQRVRRNAVAAR